MKGNPHPHLVNTQTMAANDVTSIIWRNSGSTGFTVVQWGGLVSCPPSLFYISVASASLVTLPLSLSVSVFVLLPLSLPVG